MYILFIYIYIGIYLNKIKCSNVNCSFHWANILSRSNILSFHETNSGLTQMTQSLSKLILKIYRAQFCFPNFCHYTNKG